MSRKPKGPHAGRRSGWAPAVNVDDLRARIGDLLGDEIEDETVEAIQVAIAQYHASDAVLSAVPSHGAQRSDLEEIDEACDVLLRHLPRLPPDAEVAMGKRLNDLGYLPEVMLRDLGKALEVLRWATNAGALAIMERKRRTNPGKRARDWLIGRLCAIVASPYAERVGVVEAVLELIGEPVPDDLERLVRRAAESRPKTG